MSHMIHPALNRGIEFAKADAARLEGTQMNDVIFLDVHVISSTCAT